MALLGFLFFTGVFVAACRAIAITVLPRRDYIVELLSGTVAAPALAPVAERRRVRRLIAPSYRTELSLIRAAA